MWLFAMFDLPVTTPRPENGTRPSANYFQEGFSMLQYSVYARYCASEEAATATAARFAGLPSEGMSACLAVTDRQFGKMESYIGELSKTPEAPPPQLVLF